MQEKVLKPGEVEMLFGLDETPPTGKFILYSIQHLIYFVANVAILPVIIGSHLGLDAAGLATLVQRSFLICGIASILQAMYGHRLPNIDGPAALWMGFFVILTSSAVQVGKSLALIRTDIQTGMIIAGVVCVILAVSGLMPKIARLFNPVVNGVYLMLMVLQLSASIVKGMVGTSGGGAQISGKSVFCFLLTAAIIVFFNIRTKGFIRSIATLLGVVVGWIVAVIIGISPQIQPGSGGFLTFTELFAWGTPTVDVGVILVCILGSVILFSNLIASVSGMCKITGTEMTPKMLSRSTLFFGISSILAGIGAAVGSIAYASSIGTTVMTRVAARKPFIIGASCLIILGLVSPIGAFFAAIPHAVGYSALLIIFSMILGQSLSEFSKTNLGPRESMVIGISMILGIGLMFLPTSTFMSLPQGLRYIVSNGLVVGIIIAILLEHVVLSEKNHSKITGR